MQDASAALEHSKAVYRALYEQMQQEKQELAQSSESLKCLKDEFQEKFRSWYNTSYMGSACDDDGTPQDSVCRTNPAAIGQPGSSVQICPTMSSEGIQHFQPSAQGSSSAKHRPADYNDESRKFYDAQHKLALSAGCSPTHGKLRHLGKGWRISG